MQKSPEEMQKQQLPLRKSSKPLRLLKQGAEPVSSNEIWLLTLSDLLMLLMIFLVFMLAVPFANSSKAQSADPVLSEKQKAKPAVKPVEKEDPEKSDAPAVAQLEQDLQAALIGGSAKGITVERRPHAVIITFPEQILFDSGQAQLKPVAQPTLTAVAGFITNHPELSVEVQGHTDDRPIKNSRYPSNWELSADRATQVAKSLVNLGADPVKIATKGLGEFHPVVANDNDEGRLKNRRVEIQFSL